MDAPSLLKKTKRPVLAARAIVDMENLSLATVATVVDVTAVEVEQKEEKTVKELVEMCRARGIKGYSGKPRQELLRLLGSSAVSAVSDVSAVPSVPVNQPLTGMLPSAPKGSPPAAASAANTPLRAPLNGLSFIDLFCGIGGFHCALTGLGAQCVLACDIDEKCRAVYEENWGIRPHADIRALRSEDIPDFDILCGGFPCQAFSHAGKQGGFEDTRGTLFQEIARILRDKQPRYYVLENVKNLRGHDGGKTLAVIQAALKEAGYTPYPELICLSPHQLGVPQHRERVFLLGVRNDFAVNRVFKPFPVPKKEATDIRDVLEEEKGEMYPSLEIGAGLRGVLDCWEEFLQGCKERGIRLPTFPVWTGCWISPAGAVSEADQAEAEAEVDEKMESVEKMPKWKQEFIRKNQEFYRANKEFLEPWLSRARQQKGFEGAKTKFEWQCGPIQEGDSLWNLLFTFRPSGIRVKRGDYSPALVAMAQIVYVGERGRKLSPREVCRLQSFPESFRLPTHALAYKQFGNSVNVRVVEEMARFLVEMLI